MLTIFRCIIVICSTLILFQLMVIVYHAKKASGEAAPFERRLPSATMHVLFAGDSTALGTGASHPSKSTAGWFGRDYPNAHIVNLSHNGMRLRGLQDMLAGINNEHFDLAIFQIGANDIMHFTPLSVIEKQMGDVLQLAKAKADRVIILHSGNIGDAPIFFWPFSWMMTWRSLKVREIYKRYEDERVAYVDIYQLEKSQKLNRNMYAEDNLHLNDDGYQLWYQFIKTKLKG